MRIATLLVLSLTLGCNAPENSPPVAAKAQAPAASKPPLFKTEKKVEVEKVEVEFEPTKDPQITWFKGIKHLPQNHPCSDNAVVVRVDYECDGPTGVISSTLEQLRERELVHLGARTVRGARWSDDAGEHMIVTCDLSGLGFRPVTDWDREQFKEIGFEDKKGATASWVEIDYGEPTLFERTFVHWMSKPNAAKEWSVDQVKTRASEHYEGHDPQYIARSWIVDVADKDQDGVVESTVLMVGDCKHCRKTHKHWSPFTIDLFSHPRGPSQVTLDHLGKLLPRDTKTLDATEERGVAKAVAILREAKALR